MSNYDMDEIERQRRKTQEESIKGAKPKRKPTACGPGNPMIETKSNIPISLPNKDAIKLAILAHENNVTLNAYCIDILRQGIESGEHRFEHDSRPQLLNES
jgi:hypothetical protein